MKKILLILLSIFSFSVFSQIKNAEQLISAMQKKYAGKWCRNITFVQDNKHYKNDTIAATSVWHEAIEYPDKFRIDFGNSSEGNSVIFRNDSVYNFRKGELKRKDADKNDLLLLLGGMYFRTKEDVKKRLKEFNFDLTKFSENTFNNSAVYVIGAANHDTITSQFWVDKKTLLVIRMINKMDEERRMDIRFSNFQKNCGGYTETSVNAFINGKLEQVEQYRNIKTETKIPSGVFDPAQFGKVHWEK